WPCRSPSLPHSGVAAVAATTYTLTSHDTSLRWPRSLAMVGRPVERTVWSRTAGSMATTRAANPTRTPPGVPGPEPVISSCVPRLIGHLPHSSTYPEGSPPLRPHYVITGVIVYGSRQPPETWSYS